MIEVGEEERRGGVREGGARGGKSLRSCAGIIYSSDTSGDSDLNSVSRGSKLAARKPTDDRLGRTYICISDRTPRARQSLDRLAAYFIQRGASPRRREARSVHASF